MKLKMFLVVLTIVQVSLACKGLLDCKNCVLQNCKFTLFTNKTTFCGKKAIVGKNIIGTAKVDNHCSSLLIISAGWTMNATTPTPKSYRTPLLLPLLPEPKATSPRPTTTSTPRATIFSTLRVSSAPTTTTTTTTTTQTPLPKPTIALTLPSTPKIQVTEASTTTKPRLPSSVPTFPPPARTLTTTTPPTTSNIESIFRGPSFPTSIVPISYTPNTNVVVAVTPPTHNAAIIIQNKSKKKDSKQNKTMHKNNRTATSVGFQPNFYPCTISFATRDIFSRMSSKQCDKGDLMPMEEVYLRTLCSINEIATKINNKEYLEVDQAFLMLNPARSNIYSCSLLAFRKKYCIRMKRPRFPNFMKRENRRRPSLIYADISPNQTCTIGKSESFKELLARQVCRSRLISTILPNSAFSVTDFSYANLNPAIGYENVCEALFFRREKCRK